MIKRINVARILLESFENKTQKQKKNLLSS